jgi:tRNA-dihydrouridine synthase A
MKSLRPEPLDRRLCIAPMMDWTDRHCRYFLRLLSPHALLYTEMVATGALIHGDTAAHLEFEPAEQPVALQVGGSDPRELARCASLGWNAGYDEINLNCGCPSDRVQNGRFGACLMAQPALVAECVAAMRACVPIPVTVKTRLGIDDLDTDEHLVNFIDIVRQSGCDTFILHARKAWLNGLSPKQNREIPPLQHDRVYRIKRDFPELTVVINGGITSVPDIEAHLAHVDGAMIGREAYHNPYLLADIEREIFLMRLVPDRQTVLARFADYAEAQERLGVPAWRLVRHLLGLYQGQPGARRWRRYLSETGHGAIPVRSLIESSLDLSRTARFPGNSAAGASD